MTLLTSPNFPILLVHATVLYHNATKGEGFDSGGFYLNGCITVASSGKHLCFLGGKGVLVSFPCSYKTPTNRCKSYIKRKGSWTVKRKLYPISSECQGKIPRWCQRRRQRRHMGSTRMTAHHCTWYIRSLTTMYLVSRCLQWPKPLHPFTRHSPENFILAFPRSKTRTEFS